MRVARSFLIAAMCFSFASGCAFAFWVLKLIVANFEKLVVMAQSDPALFSWLALLLLSALTFVFGVILAQYPRWR